MEFVTSYDTPITDESWGIESITYNFYDYQAECDSPFVLSDDENWCECPDDSYFDSVNTTCIFCVNN